MENKRKKITLRYHYGYDIVYTILVYVCSAVLFFVIYKKLEPKITEKILIDYIKLSVVINTAIYGLVSYICIKIKKRRKWTIVVDENGNVYYNKEMCRMVMYLCLDQIPFGTCNIKIYSCSNGKKLTCMKHVSKKILNYIEKYRKE